MKIWARTLFLMTLGLLTALPVQAARGGHGIQDRMDRQQTSIERGLESGALTRREARSLRREQREIREIATELRQGHFSRHERHLILDARLDRAKRYIRKLKHNQDVAYRHWDNSSTPH